MMRSLALSLEEFGSTALDDQAERLSVSPAELASRAARYYLADRDSGRLALRLPRLPTGTSERPARELSIDLEPDAWRDLDAEAARQDVSVEALLEHAILYFLADLDAGRVEWRMLEDETA